MSTKTKAVREGYCWVILAVTFLAGLTAPVNMFKCTALAVVIMDAYGIKPSVLGWIIAMFYVLGFVLAFPSAKIIKTFGNRKVISLAVLCGIIGSLLGAISKNLAVFMLSRMLEGAGLSILGVAGASAITPWFPMEKRGLAIGTWSMRVPVAGLTCPLLFGWLVGSGYISYIGVWWGTAVFGFIALVVFNIFYRDAEAGTPNGDKPAVQLELRRVLKNKKLVALAAAFFFCECSVMATMGFQTTYLQKMLGTTLIFATSISTLSSTMSALAAPVTGKISDVIHSRRKCLIAGFVVGIIYMALVFNLRAAWLYYPLCILSGFFGGGVPAIIWASVPETVERADVPTANATVAFAQNVGMFLGSTVMGNVITVAGWTAGTFIVQVPCVVLCLLITIFGLKELD